MSVIDRTMVIKTLAVGDEPDASAYDSGNTYVYIANYNSANATVVDGTNVIGTIEVGRFPDGVAYDSGNGYVYVANDVSNNVSVINGTAGVASIGSGIGPVAVTYNTGDGYVYVLNFGSDTVSAIFTGYEITFTATGLSEGTRWSVILNGTLQDSISTSVTFGEPDGTYSYTVATGHGYTAAQASGVVAVDGANRSVEVTFVPPDFAVSFAERGLPTGVNWSITMEGVTNSSNTTTIGFQEPNGTYAYLVGVVPGWWATLFQARRRGHQRPTFRQYSS